MIIDLIITELVKLKRGQEKTELQTLENQKTKIHQIHHYKKKTISGNKSPLMCRRYHSVTIAEKIGAKKKCRH